MDRFPLRRGIWLLLMAALVLLVAAPLASAADPELRAAPLSKGFRQYQAQQAVGRALSLHNALGLGLGLIAEPMDPSIIKGSGVTSRAAAALPPAFDLRAMGKLTPIRDQGQYGTCWTFATYASLESCLLPAESRDFSEDNMARTSGFDNGGDPYDHGGNTFMSTPYLIRWSGPVNEADDAYGDSYTPAGLSAQKHVQEMLYIEGGASGADTARIKAALMTYGAIATSMTWEDSCYSAGQRSYYYNGSASTDHAVSIVGWDDSFAASRFNSSPAGNGAWLVRNSWGSSWGDGGYFWASYYDAHLGRDNVWNAVFMNAAPTTNYSTLYSHDPLGQVDNVGYGDDTAWAANVFTAASGQAISAVGFYTHVPGTTYTVYTGPVTSAGSPGAMSAKGSGTIDIAGFHTVAFSSPRWAAAGSKFAVAIKLTAPGSQYPIALEYAETGWSSAAWAQPGQSYMRHGDTSTWYDITGFDSTGNVCVKAYAVSDTAAPTTVATAASVKRNASVTLKFRVNDPLPSCGSAVVKIEIRKGSKVVKTISVGTKSANAACTYKWKATLPKGTYSWRAKATDMAGHAASSVGSAKLVIK